jgi:dienelactone hydrolase
MEMKINSFLITFLLLVMILSTGCATTIRYDVPKNIDLSDIISAKPISGFQKESIYGELYLPKSEEKKVPAVIIMHSSGGVFSWREIKMAKELNAHGIAAFVPYSFSARGVHEVKQTSGTDISFGMLMADAYAALNLLSSNPKINSEKIAIMGYSSGGVISLLSDDEKVRKVLANPGLKFAAHVNVYTPALFIFENPSPTKAPMLFLNGESDDICPIDKVMEYVEKLKKSGAEVHTIVYPNAFHGFDSPGPLRRVYSVTNDSTCQFEIMDNGMVKNTTNAIIFSERDWPNQEKSCANTRGMMKGNNSEAADKYMKDAIDFLVTSLK